MIFWLASYPKSGNTWIRTFISTYYFTNNDKFELTMFSQFEQETNCANNTSIVSFNQISSASIQLVTPKDKYTSIYCKSVIIFLFDARFSFFLQ